jgi:hypothetical protein
VPIVYYTSIVVVEVCLYDSLAAIVKEHQDPKTTGRYAHSDLFSLPMTADLRMDGERVSL